MNNITSTCFVSNLIPSQCSPIKIAWLAQNGLSGYGWHKTLSGSRVRVSLVPDSPSKALSPSRESLGTRLGYNIL